MINENLDHLFSPSFWRILQRIWKFKISFTLHTVDQALWLNVTVMSKNKASWVDPIFLGSVGVKASKRRPLVFMQSTMVIIFIQASQFISKGQPSPLNLITINKSEFCLRCLKLALNSFALVHELLKKSDQSEDMKTSMESISGETLFSSRQTEVCIVIS